MSTDIENLVRRGETERLDFKASVTDTLSAARIVCSFLNSNGGTLITGLDDSGSPTGVISAEDAGPFEQAIRRSISPSAMFGVGSDMIGGHTVLVVEVPAGSQKPYVCDGKIFVRVGASTMEAVPAQSADLIAQRQTSANRWERRIALSLSLSDLDLDPLKRTIEKGRDRGYRFQDATDLGQCLSDLSLARQGQLTNACDVAFGIRVSTRNPQTRVRAVRFESDRAGAHLDEQVIEGPAPSVLETLMDFARRHVQIEGSFDPDQLERLQKPAVPFDALREGLVNALVHREYESFGGGVALRIYQSRVEVWNSGSFPSGYRVADLRKPEHASVLVNPDISMVFYLLGLMERTGRGAYTIIKRCRDLGLPDPAWVSINGGVLLTLGFMPLDLTTKHLDVLKLADAGDITVSDIDLPDRTARRLLKELVDAGYLHARGEARLRTYGRTGKSY